jgi:importin subunit beta-1
MVLGVAPPNQTAALEELLKLFLDRIESTLQNGSKQPQKQDLQGLLCGVVQVITSKLEAKVKPYADRIMSLIYKFFKSGMANSDLHQESFLIVSAIVNAVGHDFVKYMNEFHECLYIGLANVQEYQVCQAAVGLVGDIARKTMNQLMPYCDKIVVHLLQNLSKPELDKSIKPVIITCFGDIAVAIGPLFSKYFEVVMSMLKQAGDTVSHTNIAEADDQDDIIDYLNSLRESIFEAYTGIFQSLCASKTPDLIVPYLVNSIIPLVNNVYADVHRSEVVAVAAVGLCGDIAAALGQRVRSTLSAPHILRLIDDTKAKAEQANTKGICDFAQRAISQM